MRGTRSFAEDPACFLVASTFLGMSGGSFPTPVTIAESGAFHGTDTFIDKINVVQRSG